MHQEQSIDSKQKTYLWFTGNKGDAICASEHKLRCDQRPNVDGNSNALRRIGIFHLPPIRISLEAGNPKKTQSKCKNQIKRRRVELHCARNSLFFTISLKSDRLRKGVERWSWWSYELEFGVWTCLPAARKSNERNQVVRKKRRVREECERKIRRTKGSKFWTEKRE